MATVDSQVRAWLMSELPGLVEADNPQECMRMAWAASGVECSVQDFEQALWRSGFKPDVVQGRYRLALPAPPVEGKNPYHALRNIRSRIDGLR